jgi:hypothetical protein
MGEIRVPEPDGFEDKNNLYIIPDGSLVGIIEPDDEKVIEAEPSTTVDVIPSQQVSSNLDIRDQLAFVIVNALIQKYGREIDYSEPYKLADSMLKSR